uniref:Transcription initiation factor IIA gamma subunit N-terminal domain-containing protein n=1 Tax=Aegilops tauschii subsp. strangulata TaxID=200361 RepID=A0A452XLJ9_AEGTS
EKKDLFIRPSLRGWGVADLHLAEEPRRFTCLLQISDESVLVRRRQADMATFELYRRSTIGMCLTETLDEMVSSGTLSPELAIQVLVQFDKSMTEALENQVKSKVTVKVRALGKQSCNFSRHFGVRLLGRPVIICHMLP